MAKKNVRDEPMKTQVTENDQLSDIVFILDKMELLLQAISEIDKNGRYKTVPADKEHRNSFLKIDRYASMFENFLKNFWSQFKDPTRFGLLTIKEDTLDSPEVLKRNLGIPDWHILENDVINERDQSKKINSAVSHDLAVEFTFLLGITGSYCCRLTFFHNAYLVFSV